MISKEHLDKFKALYKNRFGKDLTDQETHEKGSKLPRLIGLVYKPITQEEFEKLQKRRQETNSN